MKKLAITLMLFLPALAGAACTPSATGLGLCIPNFGDRWDVWSEKARTNFVLLNSSVPIASSTPTYSSLGVTNWITAGSSIAAGAGFYGAGTGLTAVPAGQLTGTVPTGSVDLSTVTSALGLKVNKAGDTMTGDLSISKSDPVLRLNSSSGLGVYAIATGGVDRFVGGADSNSGVMYLVDNSPAVKLNFTASPTTGNFNFIGWPLSVNKVTSPTHALDVTGGGVFSSSVTAASFHGPLTGNVTGAASLNVLKAGDTMTGDLTVPYLIASSATIEAIYGSTLTLTGGLYGPWAVYSDSVTASEFYGDGSNLSGVVTSEVDPLSVPLAGGNMTGQLTTASTITVQGNAFSVGGSTLVVKEGKVGIGTASPAYGLDVTEPIAQFTRTMIGNRTGPKQLSIDENSSVLRINTSGGGAYPVSFNSGSLYIGVGYGEGYGSARVGIGTTSPASKLHVVGDATISTSLTAASAIVTGNAFSVGGSTLVVTAGLVGIGTTSPASKLHLSSGTFYNDGTGAGITTTGTMTPVVYAAAQIILTAPAALYGYATCSDCTNGGTAVPPILCISTSTAAGGWKAISTLSGSAGCYP